MTPAEETDASLDELAELFKKSVKIEDRKFHLTTYKDCFVGKEAVDFLVETGSAQSREDAVTLGLALQTNFHLFEHVTRDHAFADDKLFYRFLDSKERGSFSVDDEGKKVDWSRFLAPASGGDHDSLQPGLPQPDFAALDPKDVHIANNMWPLDDYNTTLLNNVHPPAWQDPLANNKDGSSSYDLVVIGGGTGGLISAAGSAGVGAKVAMIEEHMLGGDWYVLVSNLHSWHCLSTVLFEPIYVQ
jgi:hypothetical protein